MQNLLLVSTHPKDHSTLQWKGCFTCIVGVFWSSKWRQFWGVRILGASEKYAVTKYSQMGSWNPPRLGLKMKNKCNHHHHLEKHPPPKKNRTSKTNWQHNNRTPTYWLFFWSCQKKKLCTIATKRTRWLVCGDVHLLLIFTASLKQATNRKSILCKELEICLDG